MNSAIHAQLAANCRSRDRFYGAPWVVAAMLAILVGGCASMQDVNDLTPDAKKALVSKRVNARWAALIKGDLDQAYTFMSAGSQTATPLEVYKVKIKPGMWRAVKINSMDCDAEVCRVNMTLTYDHRMMKGIQTPFQETWILEKGNAWYVYQGP